ncbi:hypothetical protein [Aquiflexum lacus]|nr:hypothetical protein [Aquiflexum lacus]
MKTTLITILLTEFINGVYAQTSSKTAFESRLSPLEVKNPIEMLNYSEER